MKKYLAMLLAVVMVFALGAKRLCSGHRRHLQQLHLHRLQSDGAGVHHRRGAYALRQRPLGNARPGHGSRDAAGLLSDLQQRGRHEL